MTGSQLDGAAGADRRLHNANAAKGSTASPSAHALQPAAGHAYRYHDPDAQSAPGSSPSGLLVMSSDTARRLAAAGGGGQYRTSPTAAASADVDALRVALGVPSWLIRSNVAPGVGGNTTGSLREGAQQGGAAAGYSAGRRGPAGTVMHGTRRRRPASTAGAGSASGNNLAGAALRRSSARSPPRGGLAAGGSGAAVLEHAEPEMTARERTAMLRLWEVCREAKDCVPRCLRRSFLQRDRVRTCDFELTIFFISL